MVHVSRQMHQNHKRMNRRIKNDITAHKNSLKALHEIAKILSKNRTKRGREVLNEDEGSRVIEETLKTKNKEIMKVTQRTHGTRKKTSSYSTRMHDKGKESET